MSGALRDTLPPSSRAASRPLGYEHSLDGVRALCLLAVFAYHAGLPEATGGYLGVSTFFTLSGFLITRLLVREAADGAGIRVGAFWVRRALRLLPASLATLGILALSAHWWIPEAQLERLGADLLACLVYVINWRFIDAGYAYALLFVSPSEVQHFWSLAIEGQFYLLFPFVVALAYRGRPRRRLLASLLTAGVLTSLAWGAWLFSAAGQERVYFGTDTRLAELLVGGLLALLLPGALASNGEPHPRARLLDIGGLAALAGLVACWVFVPLDTAALYRGGFGLYSALSALVLAGCLNGAGQLRRLLSPAPLRWVGRVSYGAYLYHWPILVALEPLGFDPLAKLAIALPATLLLAGLSHQFFEEPIRRLRGTPRFPVGWVSAAAAIGVALLITLQFPVVRDDAREIVRAVVPRPAADENAIRISVLGDSTAYSLLVGLERWVREQSHVTSTPGIARAGCGLQRSWLIRDDSASAIGPNGQPPCRRLWHDVAQTLQQGKPHVAIVIFGPWEIEKLRISRADSVPAPRKAQTKALMREAIAAFTELVSSHGTHLVWIEIPLSRAPKNSTTGPRQRERRRQRFNEALHEQARATPERLTVVDMTEQLATLTPEGSNQRPDGIHFSGEGAHALFANWLGPRVVATAAAKPSLAAPVE